MLFGAANLPTRAYDPGMTTLDRFIEANRDELIQRCQTKSAGRSAPAVTPAGVDSGVPLFLDQLVVELRQGPSQTRAIATSAGQHGRDLLEQGFTLAQVVHDYGDLCQSVTDLAIETEAPIETADFRTLNRCLDDAIAGAVAEHARVRLVAAGGRSDALRRHTETAISAFTALQAGLVGISGSTGSLLGASLMDIRAVLEGETSEENDS